MANIDKSSSRLIALSAWVLSVAFVPAAKSYQSSFTSSSVIRSSLEVRPLEELIEKEITIKKRLQELAAFEFAQGNAPSGYLIDKKSAPGETVWIEVSWGEERMIDQIILSPVISSQNRGHTSPYFPNRFQVYIRNSQGETLVDERISDHVVPDFIAPYCIEIPPTPASAVRVVADGDSAIGSVGFNEILVFSGHENVALHQSVTSSEPEYEQTLIRWKKDFLVDGYLPYQVGPASTNVGFRFDHTRHPLRSITMDLGEVLSISAIHLHPNLGDSLLPQGTGPGYGFPTKLSLEVSMDADFTDVKTVAVYPERFINSGNRTVMFPIAGQEARYIRLNILRLFRAPHFDRSMNSFALSEIEVFSEGFRCSTGKSLKLGYSDTYLKQISEESIRTLNDGIAQFGEIPYVDIWLAELSERFDLESTLVEIAHVIRMRHEKQSKRLQIAGLVIAVLAVALLILYIFHRYRQQKVAHQTREQIAADLHDDLGADLDTITMLGRLAAKDNCSAGKQASYIDNIINIARHSSDYTRHLISIIGKGGDGGSLLRQMRKTSDRMLADYQTDFHTDGFEPLDTIRPESCLDILLFYKEALHNIIKHADADRVDTSVRLSGRQFRLQVCDNGVGHAADGVRISHALKKRATRLGGKANSENNPEGGVTIHLSCKL
jgi:signal transduction histidine kinase|tara:strand:- start:1388 stop:3379 length:1992 start_codon:yes stop_codon:yes gene_type:complete